MGSRPRVGIGVPGHVLLPVQKEIRHTTNKKTGHLANAEIPQMADASRGRLWYNRHR